MLQTAKRSFSVAIMEKSYQNTCVTTQAGCLTFFKNRSRLILLIISLEDPIEDYE